MSTYLQLANLLIQKCGISGGPITTVSGQTGEAGRVAAWIAEAYTQIQLVSPSWNWMQGNVSFETVANQGSYTPAEAGITDLGNWKAESFRRYITATGVRSEIFLSDISYDNFRDTYLFGNMRLSYGTPSVIAFGPDYSINLGLAPDSGGYTVVGRYFKAPTTLTADGDVPALPVQYHSVIVYRAMMMYGMYESAQEVVIEGTSLYNGMIRRLSRDQMPDAELGRALA